MRFGTLHLSLAASRWRCTTSPFHTLKKAESHLNAAAAAAAANANSEGDGISVYCFSLLLNHVDDYAENTTTANL